MSGVHVIAAEQAVKHLAPPHPATQPAVAAPAPGTQPAGPLPKLACEEPTFNFPDTWAGDKVEHTFKMHNAGEGTLEIINVKPGCGCTVAGQFDKSIAPGKDGKVPVALNTGRQNSTVEKKITVESNDPANKFYILTLKGNIKMRLVMEPPNGAAWGHITPQSPEAMTVKVRNQTDKPMKLEAIPDPHQTMFEATIKEVEPGKAAEIVVKLKQPVRDGTSIGNLRFKTGIEGEAELSIPCNAYKAPVIEVMPAAISASMAPNQPFKQSVNFRYNGDGKMKIESVKPSTDKIQTQLSEREVGKTFELMVSLPVGFEATDEKPAEIVVATDVKEHEKISIPVRVRVNTPMTQPAMTVLAESLIGKPAPAVGLKDASGRNVNIGGARDEVTVVNFWASWCAICKKELPVLQKVNEVYSKKGVRFVNISTDGKVAGKEVEDAAKKLQVDIPIALDPNGDASAKYGANRVPTLFLINKKGIIEKVHRGIPPTFEADLKNELDTLLQGKPLAQAQPTPAVAPLPHSTTRPSQASIGPAFIVEPLNQDMGRHKPSEQVQYTVNYRNGGTQPLTIKSVKPSDGLQVEPGYTTKLEPGASSSVKVSLTAPGKPGPILHQLAFQTDDASSPTKIVKLYGSVRSMVEYQPPTGVNFPRNRRTQNIPSLATLVYNGEGKIEYGKPESSSPKFEATIEPIPNGPYAKLVVTPKPPFDAGENDAVIHVKTSCKEQPMVDVPVKFFLPGRVEITPAEVVLPGSTHLQRSTVMIKNNGDRSLNILGVKASNEQIRTQFYPDSDGMSYNLMLIIPAASDAAAEKEERSEKVTIRTDDPEYGEIVIPIRVGGAAAASDKVSRTE
jgi:thiol-disulfide isomerase/thioredoxin